MTATLEELLRQRAEDMAALLDTQLPMSSSALLDPEDPLPAVDLLACSARELAWLQQAVALVSKQTTRTLTAPRATTGVVTPFEPSVLTVMYTARYFLAIRSPSMPPSPRDAYVVYGARKCEALPEGLRMLEIADQPT
ncbi:MAG TPA: hypothetical protein VF469_06595 [Kofleriaceae bacterium]